MESIEEVMCDFNNVLSSLKRARSRVSDGIVEVDEDDLIELGRLAAVISNWVDDALFDGARLEA